MRAVDSRQTCLCHTPRPHPRHGDDGDGGSVRKCSLRHAHGDVHHDGVRRAHAHGNGHDTHRDDGGDDDARVPPPQSHGCHDQSAAPTRLMMPRS